MQRPIHVLQVLPRLRSGGTEITTIQTAEAIAAAGGRSVVFAAPGPMVAELEAVGGVFEPGPADSKNPFTILVGNVLRLRRLIRRHGIDIVHARSRAPAWSALIAARAENAAFVTTYHGIYAARSPLKRWYNSVMARGDMVIANSAFTQARVEAEHGLPPERFWTAPCGVDLRLFSRDRVAPERVEALARAWNLDPADERPIVLLPGRLTAWKGQRVMIEAAGRLRDRGIGARVLLAGDAQGRDAYAEGLKARIAELNLGGMVRLVGHCADMPAALMLADIVALPSTEAESFGRAATEAQAMRAPVVASRLGALVETVADGASGLLTPPGDSGALAEALERLILAPRSVRETMGLAGRRHVENGLTAEALGARTLALYRRLMAERSAP